MPEGRSGCIRCFDHIRFWVSNAELAVAWYCQSFGFQPYAFFRHGNFVTRVVKQNEICLVFTAPIHPCEGTDFGDFLKTHGDAVRDVAFAVDDLAKVLKVAMGKNARMLTDGIEVLRDDAGDVRFASIHAYGDIVHTLVERSNYRGPFMPGFVCADCSESSEFAKFLCSLSVVRKLAKYGRGVHDPSGVDLSPYAHVEPQGEMLPVAEWYQQCLQLHRFWSIDDAMIKTAFSGLRSTVLANSPLDTVKLLVIEPGEGNALKSKQLRPTGQIEEFLDYNGSPGIQHIAFETEDIVQTIDALMQRGVEFLPVPATYYEQLRLRLEMSEKKIKEALQDLKRLNILVDFDAEGYLLQIFTKPVQDRPTLFLEIIQRHNHNGFGAGNIQALFEAVELEQIRRNSLLPAAQRSSS